MLRMDRGLGGGRAKESMSAWYADGRKRWDGSGVWLRKG